MRLYLINPSNPLVSIVKIKESRWNRYRVWKPLSLMVLAGLTPPEWEISIVDENLGARTIRPCPGRTWWALPLSPPRRTAPMKWPITSGVRAYPSSWAAFTQPCAWRRSWSVSPVREYRALVHPGFIFFACPLRHYSIIHNISNHLLTLTWYMGAHSGEPI
jgi:hypothetical protein